MKMDFKWMDESELALKAVSTSADMIEETHTEGLAISTKSSYRDIVTELDIAIEQHIKKILSVSKYGIVGEESTKGDALVLPAHAPVWMVDPIDGTTNFISSIPFYSSSVGLIEGNKFLVGAVAMPALKEIYFTMGDEGAYKNGKRLRLSPAKLKDSLVVASFSGIHSDDEKRRNEYKFFGNVNDASRGCLRLGSASVNICYVASGRLQASYGIANRIWDVAGAVSVAQRAGAKVYYERLKDSSKVNFAVGCPDAIDELAEMLRTAGLADLKPLN
jgi:myo-inositol-1(or 4)-monophosphatase